MVKLLKLVNRGSSHTSGCPHQDLTAHQLSSLLRDCIRRVDLHEGRSVHDCILRHSSELQLSLGHQLIRLYASCGCLSDANHVFNGIPKPDVYAWSAIIFANVKLGQRNNAIELYGKMQDMLVETDNHVLVATLRACADVSLFTHGKLLHHHVVELNSDSDAYIGSSLVDFYAKGGALEDSYRVFNRLKKPDKVTWGIMIGAYTQHGHGQQALYLYKLMVEGGMDLDNVIFLCALKACCKVLDSEQVRVVHSHLVMYGLELENTLGNALVNGYAKCGSMEEASNVFTFLPNRDVITWGAIIEGHVQHGFHEDALWGFQEMQVENMNPDQVVAMSCLKVCSHLSTLCDGKLIHSYIVMNNFESDLQVGCSIIDMYAKWGSLDDAIAIFYVLPHHNVVIFNTIISACLQHGHTEEAICLFQQMLQQQVMFNEVTYVCMLKVCSGTMDLCLGRIVHSFIIESGPELGSLVINTLTDVYAKCGVLNDAQHVFDRSGKQDAVTWGVLILGFAQHGYCEESCKYFCQMLGEGLEADEVAFLGGLKACTGAGDLDLGRIVHAQIIASNGKHDTLIANTLIDFYGKCGSFNDAFAVFMGLKIRNHISYNAMIAACAQYNQFQKSLHLFGEMVESGMLPSQVTLACTISACANVGALDYGKLIHSLFAEMDLKDNLYITNALVDMYGKCGSPESALKVFNDSSKRDIVTWNAIVAGCVQYSMYERANFYFGQMCKAGIKPDGVTFLSLLSACSHAGSVEEGHRLFRSMKRDYGLTPTSDHYNCMLDLLGRAGYIEQAADFYDCTPRETTSEGQTSLLSHCKEKGLVELGHLCFDHLINLDDSSAVD